MKEWIKRISERLRVADLKFSEQDIEKLRMLNEIIDFYKHIRGKYNVKQENIFHTMIDYESIRQVGMHFPIILRERGDGIHEIVRGRCRIACAQNLGYEWIYALIEGKSDEAYIKQFKDR
jgi:hypothetical protein